MVLIRERQFLSMRMLENDFPQWELAAMTKQMRKGQCQEKWLRRNASRAVCSDAARTFGVGRKDVCELHFGTMDVMKLCNVSIMETH